MAKPRKILILFRVPVSGPRGRPTYVWRRPPVQLPKGSTVTITVVAYDADGDLTPLIAPVLWAVSDPAMATIVGGPGATATMRTLRAGNVVVTARSGNLVVDAALEVQPGPPVRLELQFTAA